MVFRSSVECISSLASSLASSFVSCQLLKSKWTCFFLSPCFILSFASHPVTLFWAFLNFPLLMHWHPGFPKKEEQKVLCRNDPVKALCYGEWILTSFCCLMAFQMGIYPTVAHWLGDRGVLWAGLLFSSVHVSIWTGLPISHTIKYWCEQDLGFSASIRDIW